MRGADLNPVRFYPSDAMPNYTTIFPTFDNTTFGDSYFYGIAATNAFWRVHYGDMFLQFLNVDNAVKSFDIYKMNADNEFEIIGSVDSVDISPVGWIGYQIHKLTLTGLSDGFYYLKLDSYKSDIFQITSSTEFLSDVVKIQYSNSRNDFGCIFGANYFTAYFRGNLEIGEPKVDIEAFGSDFDSGSSIKLRAANQKTATLNIIGVQQLYSTLINTIFSCNTILINGVQYENSSAPDWNPVKGGDIGDMSIKLIKKINDYYHG